MKSVDYSERQQVVVNEYERHYLYQDAVIGRPFAHEALAQTGKGIVKLKLPGLTEVVAFKFVGGYQDNDGTSWYAEAFDPSGENEPTGSLHIVTAKGAPSIMGTVSYNEALYEFMPADKGFCVVYRVDNKELSDLGSCGQDNVEDKPIEQEKPSEMTFDHLKNNSQPCGRGDITILLMTSAEARNEVPANNINYVINTAVAQLKQSLVNGYVSIENVNIKTVSPVLDVNAVDFTESPFGLINDDVQNLSNSFADERQANEADLVVMFTGDAYGANGIVADIGPDFDDAYAIVEILALPAKLLHTKLVTYSVGDIKTIIQPPVQLEATLIAPVAQKERQSWSPVVILDLTSR